MLIRVDGRAARAASRRRTSCWRSSAASAPPAAPATRSSSAATPSARCRWKARMTMCNMSIEAGARAGMIAVDDTTIDYLRGRPFAPTGEMWDARRRVLAHARERRGREVRHDARVRRGAGAAAGHVGHVAGDGRVDRGPRARSGQRARRRRGAKASSARSRTWGSRRTRRSPTSAIDKVFIGSCTNSRIEDLRAGGGGRARAPRRRQRASSRWSCPGSGLVKAQAEAEGLDRVFRDAGFEWREPGCSMCLAMNDDRLEPGERCASTSNRNFEGRQGAGGRTHLVSPAMAAAAAIAGHFVDVRRLYPDDRRGRACSRFASTPGSSRRSTAPTSTPTRSSPSSS